MAFFYFLQMGSSECRAMDERALAFLKTHTDTLMVLDAKEYGMEAVPASVRAYLDPVLFYAMNCELRAARGKVFDHDPDFRRLYGCCRVLEGTKAMAFNVNALGFGDNVVDRYEHIHTMYPGGNAVNFAVYAKKCGAARSAYMGIFWQ